MLTRSQTRAFHGSETNPFVPMDWWWRTLILGYVLLYVVGVPAVRWILYFPDHPYGTERLLAEWARQFLIFLPVVFYRRSWGWLHPLIFPAILGLAKTVLQSPEQLLAPFSMFSPPPEETLDHLALPGWTEAEVAAVMLKARFLEILALVVYYAGFFWGPRLKIPALRGSRPRGVIPKMMAAVGLSMIVFLFYIEARGGLTMHMTSWVLGRHEALGGHGPILVLIRMASIAVLVWFALDRGAIRNPLFWGLGVVSLAINFLSTGSRGAVLFTIILFVMIWMIRHRTIPKTTLVILGVLAVFAFGILGSIRASTYSLTGLQWSAITEFDPDETLEHAEDEIRDRVRANGYIAVVAKGADVGFLYGSTYVAAAMFWVPRALWPDKPRGAGGLAGERIFQGGGAGYPPGAVGEAYWNFFLPGVVLVFFLYGAFHEALARFLRVHSRTAGVWILYVLTLFHFEPETTSMVTYFQLILPSTAFLWWTRALRFEYDPLLAAPGLGRSA